MYRFFTKRYTPPSISSNDGSWYLDDSMISR